MLGDHRKKEAMTAPNRAHLVPKKTVTTAGVTTTVHVNPNKGQKKSASACEVELPELVARPHISNSPVIHSVAFPDFSDDSRAEVRTGLESSNSDDERDALVSIAQTFGITWDDPDDLNEPDEDPIDRSAEPQDAISVTIREALESGDEDDILEALEALANEYEITYTEPNDDAFNERERVRAEDHVEAIAGAAELAREKYGDTAASIVVRDANEGPGAPYLVALRIEDKDGNDLSTPDFKTLGTDENDWRMTFEDEFNGVTVPIDERDQTRVTQLPRKSHEDRSWSVPFTI